MRAWSADRELELACKVGSLPDFRRALAEGANVNADGGSPLFLSIMKGNREMVGHLLEAGANPAFFLTKTRLKKLKTPQAILDALMEGAPPPVVDLGPPPGGDDDEDLN
jgi:ankyrin repeat protein